MSMGEQEEDAALMKTATSTGRVTRLTTQPTLIKNGGWVRGLGVCVFILWWMDGGSVVKNGGWVG